MLFRKFELIPIKIGFLKNFKVAQKSGQRPYTIVQGILSKMARREYSIFITVLVIVFKCTCVITFFQLINLIPIVTDTVQN